jgi:hypothetical protein
MFSFHMFNITPKKENKLLLIYIYIQRRNVIRNEGE